MNVLDLFSGIGGFSLGLERAGMRTVAFCEIEPFCRAVLRKHWPNVPIYNDVRELTADRLRADGISVDVICGGFPCQDISIAGKGAGIDGSRSGLWSEYARIIGELRPRHVIVENVSALLNRGFDRVLGDLAALRFDVEWHCIPASAIGAHHRRDRVWIVAHADKGRAVVRRRNGNSDDKKRNAAQKIQKRKNIVSGIDCTSHPNVANPECGGLQGRHVERPRPTTILAAAISRYCGGGEFGETWRIEPHMGRVAYGVPNGMDRLAALGNAVVPQIPEIIGRAIMKTVHD